MHFLVPCARRLWWFTTWISMETIYSPILLEVVQYLENNRDPHPDHYPYISSLWWDEFNGIKQKRKADILVSSPALSEIIKVSVTKLLRWAVWPMGLCFLLLHAAAVKVGAGIAFRICQSVCLSVTPWFPCSYLHICLFIKRSYPNPAGIRLE